MCVLLRQGYKAAQILFLRFPGLEIYDVAYLKVANARNT